jgi:hypothetical protein
MANPYVTIPAGPDWYQQQYYDAYLKSYMQPQQPSWWEQMLAGLTHGLGQTAPIMQRNFEAQAGLDTRLQTETMQQQGAMDRLQWSTNAQLQKAQEMFQQQQQAALQKQLMEGMSQHAFLKGVSTPEMTPQPDLVSHATLGGEALFPQGGYEPASSPQSIPYSPDRADRMGDVGTSFTMPQATLGHMLDPATGLPQPNGGTFPAAGAGNMAGIAATAGIPQTGPPSASPSVVGGATLNTPQAPLARQRSVQEVLAALGPAVVGIPDSLIKNVLEMQKAPAADKLPAELVRIAVGEIEAGRPQNAMNILTKIGQPDLLTSTTPKPKDAPAPKDPPMTESYGQWLLANKPYASIPDYYAAPLAERQAAYKEYQDFVAKQQGDIAATAERTKLEVKQPAPQGAQDKFANLERSEAIMANINSLAKRVDLSRIGGGLQKTLTDIAMTGTYNGIPIPEGLRPTFSAEEIRLVQEMENAADLVLRLRSGGQTAETELKRMFSFLASGRMTAEAMKESLTMLQRALDTERRILTDQFNNNRWLVPSSTTFTKARQFLRANGKPYDDTAVEIFLKAQPNFQ